METDLTVDPKYDGIVSLYRERVALGESLRVKQIRLEAGIVRDCARREVEFREQLLREAAAAAAAAAVELVRVNRLVLLLDAISRNTDTAPQG